MNYSEMSDFEINGMVAAATQRSGDCTQARGVTFIHEYSEPTGEFGAICCLGWKEFDPCNSWADAGPIILENKIDITFEGREPWQHKCIAISPKIIGGVRKACLHKNPLRAAMTVFLAMHDAKNE